MATNPLSAGSLASFMARSLPKEASPQIKTAADAIALAVHAAMLAVDYRLIGLGEDHKIETSSDSSEPQPLPQEWNSSSSYAFRYAHPQSSMEYLVKVNRLGTKAVVFGIGLGDDKTASFDVPLQDYISDSSLPASPLNTDNSIDEASQTLQQIFISPHRLADLGGLIRLNIISKLTPGLHKAGYEDPSASTTSTSTSSTTQPHQQPTREPQPARPPPFPANDPLAIPRPPQPHHPPGEFLPPGFEDEYEVNRPPRGWPPVGGIGGGRHPAAIGDADLYPAGLGPNDPFRGTVGPGLPRPGLGGGGMHPTFDDPLFGGRGGDGAGGFDPQAPPGARYDPVGPGMGGAPRDGRHMGGRGGGGGFPGGGLGGRPPNPFGGFGGGDFI